MNQNNQQPGSADLPKAKHQLDIYHEDGSVTSIDGYTADEVRDAIAASRRAAPSLPDVAMPEPSESLVHRIADMVMANLEDRRGVFEDIDDEIMAEIRGDLGNTIRKAFAAQPAEGSALVAKNPALQHKRYTHVDGFRDHSAYVDFAADSEDGFAVRDGVTLTNYGYRRDQAAAFVKSGDWREVAAPERSDTPADSEVLRALRDGIELQEPVNTGKALRAHRLAKVCLSGGTGPVACAMLVNIQLTSWAEGPEKAEGYVKGFNDALKYYRHALLEVATPTAASKALDAAPAGLDEAAAYRLWRDCELAEDCWFMEHIAEYLPNTQRAPTVAEWDAAMARVMQDRIETARIDGDKQGAQGDA